jgi:hypothetical protein
MSPFSLFAQDGDAGHRLFDAVQSAAVLRDRQPRAVDLAGTGLMAQLRDKFVDLCETGGADRMPFGLMAPPSPKAHNPRFSIWMISPMAVASCTSATEISAGRTPAIS